VLGARRVIRGDSRATAPGRIEMPRDPQLACCGAGHEPESRAGLAVVPGGSGSVVWQVAVLRLGRVEAAVHLVQLGRVLHCRAETKRLP
jgi:hypothetical protein